MATRDRIRGITIEIDGNTTKLQDALKAVNTKLKDTGTALGDVNRLLNLDPGNVDLLKQKQELLTTAIDKTKEKLEQEKEALKQAAEAAPNYHDWEAANKPIQESIEETREKLKKLKEQAEKTNEAMSTGAASQDQYDSIQTEIAETETRLKELREEQSRVRDEFGNPVSPEQFQNLQREISATEQELNRLSDQYRDFGSVAAQQISAAGGKMQKVGGQISDAGKALAPVSAVAAGGLTAAVKVAADFDSAMSQVAAVSGATGDDFDALRDKAREMGAKTKFSASEAADAMNYMAMAGWKTQDMLDGIEGIMNLAAASGEDLATTSDIVTDALTAFGLKAEDSGHFADILAAASSNANTNVHMMGETFKYVAPVAGALGLSAEDVSEAIGLMANSGIKASQAGTSLRAGLSRLVKPTEEMQSVMLSLGLATSETFDEIDSGKIEKAEDKASKATRDVEKAQIAYNSAVEKYGPESAKAETALLNLEQKKSNLETATRNLTAAQEGESKTVYSGSLILTDAEGNMRTMDDAVRVLREAFDGLTENEQAEAAATLFGQEAMSGWLALINASPEDVDKLSTAIANADGTAEKMAATMQDNLNGQTEILKSQLEELAISVGDVLMPVIRDILEKTQSAVDWLNGLDDGTKKNIVTIGLVVAAAAPLLIVAGKVISSVGTILTLAPKVVSGVTGIIGIAGKIGPLLTGTIIPAVGGVLTAVAPFLPWIAAAVAAIVGIIAVIKNWGAISDFLAEKWQAAKETLSLIWEAIGTAALSKFNEIKDGIKSKIDAAREAVRSAVEKIKSIFSFKWELPKIKLPKFKIDGEFSLVPPSVPKVAVEWYKSAYQTPAILTNPTIFGAAGGRLLGGGDGNGPEVVAGMDLLGNMMKNAMQEVLASAGAGAATPPVINLTVDVGGQFFDQRVIQATQSHNFRSGGH